MFNNFITDHFSNRLKIVLSSMLFLLLSGTMMAQDCTAVMGGTVSFPNGDTETTTISDGIADMLTFNSTVDTMDLPHEFTYVVTDNDGMILGIPPANMVDFDPAGTGICRVYGLAYTGNLQIEMGDNLLDTDDLSDECFSLSSNRLSVSRVELQATENDIFVSSNTSGEVGVFNILADGNVLQSSVDVLADDADGIFYDADTDVMYQLSRSMNIIQAYSNASTNPTLSATSTSDFTNGREIAVVGDKIIVAQDAAASNNNQNALLVYTIGIGTITLDKIHNVEINLWGIHANGNTLFAVVDNSNEIARFDNFFAQPNGPLTPSAIAAVEGLVRTHGITYVPGSDMMLLTDVGEASSSTDGAIVRITNWTAKASDGTITADEQIRVLGAASLLGNPVDIAFDADNQIVYVAERANGGGRLLGFKNPVASGGIAPIFKRLVPGASALHISGTEVEIDPCDFVDGGSVSLTDGNTETTIIVDGVADVLTFQSSIDPLTAGYNFTYVVTDADGMVLGVPPANANDFDPAGLGACLVYGLAYTGNLTVAMGDDIDGVLSDDCFDLSDNTIVVNRIEPVTVEATFFASSNTSGLIGKYEVGSDGEILASTLTSTATDADGIFYDEDNDVLYQLNRTDNVINAYSTVSTVPTLTATSSSDFSNGREIAVIGDKLILAQDANAGNGDQNRLIIYNISPTEITLDRSYDVNINLWGIHANGNQLFAVVDNSSDIAVFENIFGLTDGSTAMPTQIVTIENMVRTHGITYVADRDMMLLTDVGAASSAGDGALFRISQWSSKSADGVVTTSEQVRVAGGTSFLGNPVDIAFDPDNNNIYVAERANGGGRILGYALPVATGGIAPFYNHVFAGASALHFPGTEVDAADCDFVEGGTVSLANGDTERTIVIDGEADVLAFAATGADTAPLAGYQFTYVVTDADGIILGIPPGNEVDFDPAGLGACLVYGVSYTGNLTIAVDDNLNDFDEYSDDCSALSTNNVTINRIEPAANTAQFFVSSNNAGQVGVVNVLEGDNIVLNDFAAQGADADGIYYDADNDILYQLNRTDNRIDVYTNVNDALTTGNTPTFAGSSTSDFSNGREIAVHNGQLVVAQDANTGNGDANRFIIYDIDGTSVVLNKTYEADINLWGIHSNGDQMIAIVDNSADVAIYDDFYNQPAGNITPTQVVTIENMIRTHGITYDADEDFMILTDVGAASLAGDGALFTIENWTGAIENDTVSTSEQVRVAGGTSFLGNPVDVAYDKDNNMIYVAERANGGGRILGFLNPNASGGVAPMYNTLFPGASGIFGGGSMVDLFFCASVDGGAVTFTDGSDEQTITVNDGIDDFLSFFSTVDAADNGYEQTFVVTDELGVILGIPMGNEVNFETSGVGNCNVYNVSYTGDLIIEMGDNLLFADTIATGCAEISINSITVVRLDNFAGGGTNGTGTIANRNVTIYPSPATNLATIQIESPTTEDGEVRVLSANGAVMEIIYVQLEEGFNTLELEVANYTNGLYFVQVPGAEQLVKLVKN